MHFYKDFVFYLYIIMLIIIIIYIYNNYINKEYRVDELWQIWYMP